MKAYIIAHGTMDGYEQYPKQAEYSDIPKSIYDLRAELDNSGDFLSKPIGYYIQIDNNGVWVSIMKLMRDGESDGNRPGFFAISAFIPASQSISGGDLKDKLDAVMSQYLSSYTNGMRTCSIGVDWSFVSNASAELNTMCQPRRKTINIHYTPSNNFAYIQATTEEQIIQLLDKPFQPEYGAYKVVFIGTHLQHPMRLPLQNCLNIDLENEVYDIQWNGNKHEWPDLPTKVRKKEINSGSYTFKKDYYNPTTIQYSLGERDDANTTLTLDIPNLQPQINKITLQYSLPNANVVVGVTNLPEGQIKGSTLFFKGDEFTRTWEVYPVPLNDEYKFDRFLITPCNCPNNICFITITKMQQISLQILENGENRTINYKKNIRISKSGKSIDAPLNEVTSSLCLSIPESDDFIKEYVVSLINGVYYSLSNLREVQHGFYAINIQRKQNPQIINTEPVPQKRPVYLDCRKIDKIEVFYDGLPCKIINNRIEISPAGTRNKIFVKLGDKKLKFKKVGSDSIKIYSPLLSCLSAGKTRLLLIGIVALLMLLVSVLLTLQFTKTIDMKIWFAQLEEGTSERVSTAQNPLEAKPVADIDKIYELDRLHDELDNILKEQRIQWNYGTIIDLMRKYDNSIVVNSKESDAYKLYKELAWMQCRNRLNGYKDQNQRERYDSCREWISGITSQGVNSSNNGYATKEILSFLKDVVMADAAKQKQFFEKHVKAKEVEKMTFPEVKDLWDNFNVSSTSHPKDNKTNKSNKRSSANTENSTNQSNPPAGENVEHY